MVWLWRGYEPIEILFVTLDQHFKEVNKVMIFNFSTKSGFYGWFSASAQCENTDNLVYLMAYIIVDLTSCISWLIELWIIYDI